MTTTKDLFSSPRPVSAISDLFANIWQLGYVCTDLDKTPDRSDAFAFGEDDVFPLDGDAVRPDPALGMVACADVEGQFTT